MTPPPPPPTLIALPRSHPDPSTWQTLIAKLRAFRLHSLRVAPRVFGSTLEHELTFDDALWESRLTRDSVTTVVAVESREADARDAVSDAAKLVEREWLGFIVLIERDPAEGEVPVDRSPVPASAAGQGEGLKGEGGEKRVGGLFVLNGVFVREEQRGRGIGRLLVDACLVKAKTAAAEAGYARYRVVVLVFEDNTNAASLYMKAGFSKVTEERAVVRGEMRMKVTLDLRGSVEHHATS